MNPPPLPGSTPPGFSTVSWVLLGLAAAAALVDWVAVATRARRVEHVAKPLVIVLLIGVAVTLVPIISMRRAYFLAALVLSLGGDVFLMLPGGGEERARHGGSAASDDDAGTDQNGPVPRPPPPPPEDGRAAPRFDPFVFGLACFLVAHIDYILGFRVDGAGLDRVALALVLVAVIAVPLGTVIARALSARRQQALRVPVVAYMAVLSAMAASAVASGSVLAAAGAWSFVASDATLAWDRFVQRLRYAPVVVAVTYHTAQALLVASLVR